MLSDKGSGLRAISPIAIIKVFPIRRVSSSRWKWSIMHWRGFEVLLENASDGWMKCHYFTGLHHQSSQSLKSVESISMESPSTPDWKVFTLYEFEGKNLSFCALDDFKDAGRVLFILPCMIYTKSFWILCYGIIALVIWEGRVNRNEQEVGEIMQYNIDVECIEMFGVFCKWLNDSVSRIHFNTWLHTVYDSYTFLVFHYILDTGIMCIMHIVVLSVLF